MSGLNNQLISGRRNREETKRLEWVFIAIHSMGSPLILLLTWLHEPASTLGMIAIATLLVIGNLIAGLMNHRITSLEGQQRLSIASLIGISLIAWVAIWHFVYDFNTAAYAGFSVVIIEGAVRFGLGGSMATGVVFALGLLGAMFFRLWVYDLRFSASGYVFWALIMMVIALTVGLIAQETTRERQRNATLVHARTLDSERQRIAREIHDIILKTLQGIALEAHVLKKDMESPLAREKVRRIEEECQRSSEEIRAVIHELRGMDGDQTIGDRISSMLQEWSKTTGTKVEFEISGNDDSVPAIVAHNVRCILSEALLNVQRHAAATCVDVHIQVSPDRMQIQIRDNGLGLGAPERDQAKLSGGYTFGILGINERIEHLGGRFSIKSENGTRLTMEIPFPVRCDDYGSDRR